MNRRRIVLLCVFFLVAAGLAYYLQDLVSSILFVPASYLWWGVSILYRSIAQVVYWILLVLVIAWMALGSLYGRERTRESSAENTVPRQGPMAATARQISRTGEGMYYKWLVANRMGKLARSILTLRNGKAGTKRGELGGRDWDPPEEVAAYLVSGLMRSFADYPRRSWFSRPQATPFDIDLDRVITYLESQMENPRD